MLKSLLSSSILGIVLLRATPVSAAEDISGRWTLVNERGGERKDYTLVLKQEGEKVSGAWVSPRSGRHEITSGSIKEGTLRLEILRKVEETTRTYVVEAAKKAEGRFEGVLAIDGVEAGPAILTRVASPFVGRWNVVSKSPDGSQEYPSTMVLSEAGGGLQGRSKSTQGEIDLSTIQEDGERLRFELTISIDGNPTDFVVEAQLKDPSTLAGQWKTRHGNFSGDWSAKREAVAAAPAPAPPKPEPALAPASGDLAGRWFLLTEVPDQGRRSFLLEVTLDGNKAAAKLHLTAGPVDAAGTAAGGRLELRFAIERNGEKMDVTLVGELAGSTQLKGEWRSSGGQGASFDARKPVDL